MVKIDTFWMKLICIDDAGVNLLGAKATINTFKETFFGGGGRLKTKNVLLNCCLPQLHFGYCFSGFLNLAQYICG